MTDTIIPIMSVVATNASKLSDLSIKNGQLVFVKDKQYIALDIDNKRVFYNQIVLLQTEEERQSILAPIKGLFYFVVSTAVLWTYEDRWVQITTPPEEVVFIGVELPELGSAKTLYVNKQNKTISVWDDEVKQYVVVADKTDTVNLENKAKKSMVVLWEGALRFEVGTTLEFNIPKECYHKNGKTITLLLEYCEVREDDSYKTMVGDMQMIQSITFVNDSRDLTSIYNPGLYSATGGDIGGNYIITLKKVVDTRYSKFNFSVYHFDNSYSDTKINLCCISALIPEEMEEV